MNNLGLHRTIFNKEKNKYFLENFSTVSINEDLIFDTKEDAILKYFFKKMKSLNKEEVNLNKRLNTIKNSKEELKKQLKISEIKNKFPEKFLAQDIK